MCKPIRWADVVYYDSGTVREVAARLAETCRQYLEHREELEAACYLCQTGPYLREELPWDEERECYCCPQCGSPFGLLIYEEKE